MLNTNNFGCAFLLAALFFLAPACDLKFEDTATFMVDGNRQPITLQSTTVANPAWTPDGSGITYSVRRSRSTLESFNVFTDNTESLALIDGHVSSVFAVHPASRQIAYRTYHPTQLQVTYWPTDSLRLVLRLSGVIEEVAFSPDGDWLAVTITESLGMDFRTFRLIPLTPPGSQIFRLSSAEMFSPSWSPDGSRLAFIAHYDKNYELRIEDRLEGNRLVLLSSSSPLDDPEWSPDGAEIAFTLETADTLSVWRIDLATRKRAKVTKEFKSASRPLWSPDGRYLLIHADNRNWLFPTDGGSAIPLALGARSRAWLAPDLLMTAQQNTTLNIEQRDLQSSTISVLTQPDARHWDDEPAWFPDGRHLAFTRRQSSAPSSDILRLDTVTGEIAPILTSQGVPMRRRPAISHDGRLLAYEEGESLKMLDMVTGEVVDLNDALGVDLMQAAWSPNHAAFAGIDRESDELYIYNVIDGELVPSRKFASSVADPAWSPAHPDFGEHIMFNGRFGGLWALPRDSSEVFFLARGHHGAWEPSGERIAFVVEERIYIKHFFVPLEEQ